MWDYEMGYGTLIITAPDGRETVLLGDAAAELYEELENCPAEAQVQHILRAEGGENGSTGGQVQTADD